MTEAEHLGNDDTPVGPTVSTQEAHPWKATLRTIVAVLVALVPALQVLPAVLQEIASVPMPEGLEAWLLAAAGVLAAIAGAITRIMAMPQVVRWLEFLGLGTGEEKDWITE